MRQGFLKHTQPLKQIMDVGDGRQLIQQMVQEVDLTGILIVHVHLFYMKAIYHSLCIILGCCPHCYRAIVIFMVRLVVIIVCNYKNLI